MTAPTPDLTPDPALASLNTLVQSLGFAAVRIGHYGGAVVLEGSVPTYEGKRQVEEAAVASGLTVQNALRIIPDYVDDVVSATTSVEATVAELS